MARRSSPVSWQVRVVAQAEQAEAVRARERAVAALVQWMREEPGLLASRDATQAPNR